jgi:hypothetical protein
MGDMGAAEAGNYKGVMLCNRPSEPAYNSAPGVPHISPSVDAPSFRPVGLPAEPLGLNPAKENLVSNVLAVHDEAARRRADAPARQGPPNFMNKHRAWLAEMAAKKAALNQELQFSALAAEDKRTKFVAYTSSLRQAVRERAAEMELEGIEHMDPEQLGRDRRPAAPPLPEPEPEYELPPRQAAPAPPKPPTAAKKPAWARTEEEAEEVEDAEAAMLVDFAKDLDYDAYIDDLEVRQALGVIRERIDAQKAVEAAALAAEEADEALSAAGGDWRSQFLSEWNGDADGSKSVGGGSRRSGGGGGGGGAASEGGGGKPDWDSSTNAGDYDRGGPSTSARAMAEQLMLENPELREKHSLKSLSAMVEKQTEKQGNATKSLATVRELTAEELPPLRVVTIVENPRVPTKDVDPSNLPYLHRNPAI